MSWDVLFSVECMWTWPSSACHPSTMARKTLFLFNVSHSSCSVWTVKWLHKLHKFTVLIQIFKKKKDLDDVFCAGARDSGSCGHKLNSWNAFVLCLWVFWGMSKWNTDVGASSFHSEEQLLLRCFVSQFLLPQRYAGVTGAAWGGLLWQTH